MPRHRQGDILFIVLHLRALMASNYAANEKVDARWCDRCGTLIMGRGCSCGSEARTFRINGPGDIRPAMGEGKDLILDLLRRNFGTDGGLGDKMLFLNN